MTTIFGFFFKLLHSFVPSSKRAALIICSPLYWIQDLDGIYRCFIVHFHLEPEEKEFVCLI